MTEINNCFLNVQKYIENFGGNYLNVWAIWLHPHCMIEAEAHCVYQNVENNIIDITPHKNKYIHGKIILNENGSSRYMILNNFIKENLTKFYATLKLKPNSECICGSGLKFIDCCKKIKSIYQ